MGEIYQLAEVVYVWLGEGDDESDQVMGYLKKQACLFKRFQFAVCAAFTEESRKKREAELGSLFWRDVRCG